MKIDFFLLILYICIYQRGAILGRVCMSMCALVCMYVLYVQYVCKDVLEVFLIMLLKHPPSERAEKNIYDTVKKRTQQAVLITVDGNKTVVNMAEQLSKINCAACVFFHSVRGRKCLFTYMLY